MGYFAPTYFARTYFATEYFPSSAASPEETSVQFALVNGIYVAVNPIILSGQAGNMEVVNLGDPGSALGASVTPAGTSGAAALAIQGINGGFPLAVAFSGELQLAAGSNEIGSVLVTNFPVTDAATNADAIQANAGTATILKSSPGKLCRAVVTAAGTGPLVFYNNNSGGATGMELGVILATAEVGETYEWYMPASIGISAPVQAGNPGCTVSFI